jgi:uncharacterized protein YqgC (DUF456 family)
MEIIDISIIIISIVLMLIGFLGCFIPIIPGPPLCYISLLVVHFFSSYSISSDFLVSWAILIIAITILDIWLQIYGVKQYGGKKMAIRGSTFGLIAGIFIPPFGFIIGPFIGAFIGAYLESNDKDFMKVTKIALGSLVGFLGGVLLKVIVCGIMVFQFFNSMQW